MKIIGALLTLSCAALIWLAVAGGALDPMEWTRPCPICKMSLRKGYWDRTPWVCGRCGWSGA
jgi:hypothetical protein